MTPITYGISMSSKSDAYKKDLGNALFRNAEYWNGSRELKKQEEDESWENEDQPQTEK